MDSSPPSSDSLYDIDDSDSTSYSIPSLSDFLFSHQFSLHDEINILSVKSKDNEETKTNDDEDNSAPSLPPNIHIIVPPRPLRNKTLSPSTDFADSDEISYDVESNERLFASRRHRSAAKNFPSASAGEDSRGKFLNVDELWERVRCGEEEIEEKDKSRENTVDNMVKGMRKSNLITWSGEGIEKIKQRKEDREEIGEIFKMITVEVGEEKGNNSNALPHSLTIPSLLSLSPSSSPSPSLLSDPLIPNVFSLSLTSLWIGNILLFLSSLKENEIKDAKNFLILADGDVVMKKITSKVESEKKTIFEVFKVNESNSTLKDQISSYFSSSLPMCLHYVECYLRLLSSSIDSSPSSPTPSSSPQSPPLYSPSSFSSSSAYSHWFRKENDNINLMIEIALWGKEKLTEATRIKREREESEKKKKKKSTNGNENHHEIIPSAHDDLNHHDDIPYSTAPKKNSGGLFFCCSSSSADDDDDDYKYKSVPNMEKKSNENVAQKDFVTIETGEGKGEIVVEQKSDSEMFKGSDPSFLDVLFSYNRIECFSLLVKLLTQYDVKANINLDDSYQLSPFSYSSPPSSSPSTDILSSSLPLSSSSLNIIHLFHQTMRVDISVLYSRYLQIYSHYISFSLPYFSSLLSFLELLEPLANAVIPSSLSPLKRKASITPSSFSVSDPISTSFSSLPIKDYHSLHHTIDRLSSILRFNVKYFFFLFPNDFLGVNPFVMAMKSVERMKIRMEIPLDTPSSSSTHSSISDENEHFLSIAREYILLGVDEQMTIWIKVMQREREMANRKKSADKTVSLTHSKNEVDIDQMICKGEFSSPQSNGIGNGNVPRGIVTSLSLLSTVRNYLTSLSMFAPPSPTHSPLSPTSSSSPSTSSTSTLDSLLSTFSSSFHLISVISHRVVNTLLPIITSTFTMYSNIDWKRFDKEYHSYSIPSKDKKWSVMWSAVDRLLLSLFTLHDQTKELNNFMDRNFYPPENEKNLSRPSSEIYKMSITAPLSTLFEIFHSHLKQFNEDNTMNTLIHNDDSRPISAVSAHLYSISLVHFHSLLSLYVNSFNLFPSSSSQFSAFLSSLTSILLHYSQSFHHLHINKTLDNELSKKLYFGLQHEEGKSEWIIDFSMDFLSQVNGIIANQQMMGMWYEEMGEKEREDEDEEKKSKDISQASPSSTARQPSTAFFTFSSSIPNRSLSASLPSSLEIFPNIFKSLRLSTEIVENIAAKMSAGMDFYISSYTAQLMNTPMISYDTTPLLSVSGPLLMVKQYCHQHLSFYRTHLYSSLLNELSYFLRVNTLLNIERSLLSPSKWSVKGKKRVNYYTKKHISYIRDALLTINQKIFDEEWKIPIDYEQKIRDDHWIRLESLITLLTSPWDEMIKSFHSIDVIVDEANEKLEINKRESIRMVSSPHVSRRQLFNAMKVIWSGGEDEGEGEKGEREKVKEVVGKFFMENTSLESASGGLFDNWFGKKE